MALTEPTSLPPKLKLAEHIDRSKGETYEDLLPADRAVYDTFYAKKLRRKDPSLPGVAQEALDCVAWLREQGRSPSESWTQFGYSIEWVYKPATAEERRIVTELAVKPSADIVVNEAVPLVVADVMTAKGIVEYVKPEPVEIK